MTLGKYQNFLPKSNSFFTIFMTMSRTRRQHHFWMFFHTKHCTRKTTQSTKLQSVYTLSLLTFTWYNRAASDQNSMPSYRLCTLQPTYILCERTVDFKRWASTMRSPMTLHLNTVTDGQTSRNWPGIFDDRFPFLLWKNSIRAHGIL